MRPGPPRRRGAGPLSAAWHETDEEVFADEIAGFLAQQATEKLVKAWIALLGETYPITHDIAQPLEVLAARQRPRISARSSN